MKKYTISEVLLTHGTWTAVMQRCYHRTNSKKDRKRYAKVNVSQRWLKFENFMEDMGPRPGPQFSLDRFPKKDGHYEPGNCRWATARQQASNTRSAVLLTHDGETHPISEWARRTGLERSTIQARIKAGWSVKKTLGTPPNEFNPTYVTFAEGRANGKKMSRSQVLEMVRLAKTGKWTAAALGRRYGVSSTAICYTARQFDITFKKGRPKIR